ncbi:MAG: hypothetical protein KGN02_04130 [bacterium]|nr:hypothetical protein [bacterium]
MTKRLAIVAAALALLVPFAAQADDHHHGDNQQQHAQYCQNGQPCYGQNSYGNDDREGQDRGNPHGCVNPAGHERGWCKNQGYGNGYAGYGGYGNSNATLAGVITSVNGNTVTILQGLTTRSFDASQAFQRGAVSGQLYPTRSITAYGYYDGTGYFHAVSIR